MNDRSMQFIEQEHILQNAPKVYLVANTAEEAIGAQEKIERKGGIRLTVGMRESIVTKVYDFKFKKSGDALDRTEARLAHKAMVAAFGKANLEALEKIGPPYAFWAHNAEGDRLNPEELAEWTGNKVYWRVGDLGYQIGLRVKDPIPFHMYHQNTKRFTVKPGQLADDIIQWRADTDEWLKAKREMQLKVNAVLNSVTTFKSLQATWPDGERFWKHIPIDFPFRNQVPAVRVDELNAALGL